ncbi:BON domain-containing protein [Lentisalinibacter salinarum]|uniref:BON domain-containing protein n=1 Tax=Lentisalinibacter salinarum TaxID=2992239 RepID=UPI0038691120
MNAARSATLLLPLLLAAFGLTGCTAMLIGDGQTSGRANGQAGTATESAAGAGTTRSIGDAEVTAAVRSRLVADTSVEATGIDVMTAAGRVTLSGFVASFAERDRAGRLAAAVPGVLAVDNRLAVKARP